jgi:S1-C subfamily serine protease
MGLLSNKLTIGMILVIVGTGVGAVIAGYFRQQQESPLAPQTNSTKQSANSLQPISSQPIQSENTNFITAAVEKVGPAVVKVDAVQVVGQNPLVEKFLGDLASEERVEKGTGSGFILSADGKIVTNAHVVEGVNAQNLPTVALGNSDKLVQGEWAIAIGNPLGLDNTVTVGIVSATGRSSSQVGIPDKRVSFIQTDAAINPGNSGGPLLNARGEVIGINTAIRANAQGLGFAIPIQTASRITTQLFATGKVQHPYLGVQMIPLTAELKAGIAREPTLRSKVTAEHGAVVMEVMPSSPAEVGGIKPGDVIIKVAQQSIHTPSDVQQQVEASKIGETLKLVVDRQGQVKSLDIKPGVVPAIVEKE